LRVEVEVADLLLLLTAEGKVGREIPASTSWKTILGRDYREGRRRGDLEVEAFVEGW